MNVVKSINYCLFGILRSNKQCQLFQITRSFSNKLPFNKGESLVSSSKGKSNFSVASSAFQNVPKLSNIHDTISSIQLKKRVIRKKKALEEDEKEPGKYNVFAFATAEEYHLEKLFAGLKNQNLYEAKRVENNIDVIHAIPKYKVDEEQREIFFFRDGSVVMWNITDLESSNILKFLRQFEEDSYSERLVQSECEVMNYKYYPTENKQSSIDKGGDIVLAPITDLTLEKYAFSNGMMLSVKLGIWEASLDKYINDMEFVTEDLKRTLSIEQDKLFLSKHKLKMFSNGVANAPIQSLTEKDEITRSHCKIKMTREEVLRKHGELFALRHYLNLSSDVLDIPDFYWDNEHLENLYSQVCSYFSINRRTKVMNEKLNHCVSLIELLSSHLSNKHSTKLEWTIIILIMVEVFFETVHYVDRYVERAENDKIPIN